MDDRQFEELIRAIYDIQLKLDSIESALTSIQSEVSYIQNNME